MLLMTSKTRFETEWMANTQITTNSRRNFLGANPWPLICAWKAFKLTIRHVTYWLFSVSGVSENSGDCVFIHFLIAWLGSMNPRDVIINWVSLLAPLCTITDEKLANNHFLLFRCNKTFSSQSNMDHSYLHP